ncbi:MAG: protease inhibitor I42 family protein, partial [Chloroflexi bacterium]|nr:protease inhibitor I42 family protein [Chloroflexota bacterium]
MKGRHLTPIFVIAALAFAALACALPTPPTTVTPKPTATALVKCDISKIKITLAKQDNGKAIALKISESFVIALASNPTTGFQWAVDPYDENLLAAEKSYTGLGVVVGSGGMEMFCFTALNSGSTPLVMNYHRPFEKNV